MNFKDLILKAENAEEVRSILAQMETELDGADEQRTQEISECVTLANDRIKAFEQSAQQKEEVRKAIIAGKGNVVESRKQEKSVESAKRTLAEVRNSKEYEDAYAEYLKGNGDKEVRALLTDLVSGGTVPTPTILADGIITAWEKSAIWHRIPSTAIKGTAKYPFEFSATDASVHAEGADAPTEEELILGTVTLEPAMIKKWITISDEVLALKGADFLSYVMNEISYRITKKADEVAIAVITNAPTTATQTSASVTDVEEAHATGLTFASPLKALAELSDEATNPIAIMNKQTYFNTIMALEDSQNRPIYQIISENGKPMYTLCGMEVVFSSALANDVLYIGDCAGLIKNLPDGEEVKFVNDVYSLAEEDKVKVVGKLYAGVALVRDKFFARVSVASE